MADDPTPNPAPAPAPAPDPAPAPTPDPDGLGDAGKRAIQAERDARAAADRAARDEKARADDLAEKLKAFEDANKSDTEKAIEKARKEAADAATAEVTTKFETQLLESKVLVRAAGKLADPADAPKFIDMSALDKGTDGTVSEKTIDAAIAELVKSKPYLASGAKPGPGSPDGGARGNNTPGQLTQSDLKNMTSAEIDAARRDGRLNDLLGVSTS